MDIDKLREIEGLSVRSYNVCRASNLITIDLILNWYKKYGKFINIRNCGKKTSEELVVVCVKYLNFDIINTPTKIELEVGLKLINAVSVRAYNVCLYNGLDNIEALFAYYKVNGSFGKFRNCGLKTNLELVDFCRENININNEIQLENSESDLPNSFFFENFSLHQIVVIESYVRQELDHLNKDIVSALELYLDGPVTTQKLFDKILNNSAFNLSWFNFLNGNTVRNLANMITQFKAVVKSVYFLNEKDELINYNYDITLNKNFPNDCLFDLQGINSIFSIIDFVLKKEKIFNEKAFSIFVNKFNLYIDLPAELSNKKYNLTKERVRQICKIISNDLSRELNFLKYLIDDSFYQYDISSSDNIIFIDEVLSIKINTINGTRFTKEWIAYIVYVYYSDSFQLFGLLEDVLCQKTQNSSVRHNWVCFYIVNNKITDVFDFVLFVHEFELILNERRTEVVYFNLFDQISNTIDACDLKVVFQIMEVVKCIILNEFGLEFIDDRKVILEKNAKKPIHEYAFDALIAIGVPSSVSQILDKIFELFPFVLCDYNGVRAVLKRKYGFVPIGRSSVFGLIKWESENPNFKGGTIREIVKNFLQIEMEPQQIGAITDYVKKFRPNTYSRSVWDNLKSDTSGSFVFGNRGYIGLATNESVDSNLNFSHYTPENFKSWEQSFSDLMDFVSRNSRLPRSSGCPIEEIQLYRWYNIQKRSLDRGELELIKANQLRNISDEFTMLLPRKRSLIAKDIEEYESVIFEILRECPGQIATKESLNAELVNILKLDSQLVDKILNNADYLVRRLCLAGRPFYYYHTSSDILDISRDHDNIQDFILTNLRTADFRLEYYYKAMRKMIETPDPEIITGAISRLISLQKISQFYHKFIDKDSEILLPNRLRVILDNLLMGICESMANRRDISFMMDRDVYNNKFVNDFVSYLQISGVVKLVLYEIKIEIVYLINYNGDKVILTNNLEALFLPFVLKNYFVANKMKCEFMVLGFNVKYIYRYNLISYE